MTCKVIVKGLRLRCFHGVAQQERKVGNIFEVDATLEYPFEAALTSDSVEDTLNYAEVINIIKSSMSTPSKLLEHAAGRIYSALLAAYPSISGGYIEVRKLTPPIEAQIQSAGVSISW